MQISDNENYDNKIFDEVDTEEKQEEAFEEAYFTEKKPSKMSIIIPLVAILIVAILLGALLLFTKFGNKNDKNVDDKIVEYAEATSSPEVDSSVESDIVSREETPSEEPEVSSEPSPSPIVEELPPIESPSPIMEVEVKDYTKIKYDIKQNLSEMEGFFNENNLQALSDLAHLDRFIAMSYAYRNTSEYAYFGDVNSDGKPHGKGVAVYADNQYYCGDWVNGKREGAGVWIHYHIHLTPNSNDPVTFHEYLGEFKNDLPDGQGQDHYEYDNSMLIKNKYYILNYIGGFKEGLVDGSIYTTATDSNGGYYEFEGTAQSGSFDYLSESRDKTGGGPVMSGVENPDSYYWMTPADNRNIGVQSYISAMKK